MWWDAVIQRRDPRTMLQFILVLQKKLTTAESSNVSAVALILTFVNNISPGYDHWDGQTIATKLLHKSANNNQKQNKCMLAYCCTLMEWNKTQYTFNHKNYYSAIIISRIIYMIYWWGIIVFGFLFTSTAVAGGFLFWVVCPILVYAIS